MTGSLKRVIVLVTWKEMKDFFRDPRSLLLSLGLPLILFPLLFWVLNESPRGEGASDRVYRIAAIPPAALPLQIGESPFFEVTETDRENTEGWFYSYDLMITEDAEGPSLLIGYDNTDAVSLRAYQTFTEILSPGGAEASLPAEAEKNHHTFKPRPLFAREKAAATLLLGMILPFMFFIFAITCPLAGAADLSSGEKERNSLEPLLSTSASRTGILLGKLTAGSLTGFFSVGAYFLGCYLSYVITPEILGSESLSFSLLPEQILLLVLLMMILTLLFTALELTAGFLTRSVREAQLLSMPLLSVGMGAVYLAQNIDLKARPWFFPHIPLVNMALAIRETAVERIIPGDILWALGWSLVYISLLTAAGIGLFRRDSPFIQTGKKQSLLVRLQKKGYSK